jgi:hypothetical protein
MDVTGRILAQGNAGCLRQTLMKKGLTFVLVVVNWKIFTVSGHEGRADDLLEI